MRDTQRADQLKIVAELLPGICTEFVARRGQVAEWVQGYGYPSSSMGGLPGANDEGGRTAARAIALVEHGDELGRRLAEADDAFDRLVAAAHILTAFIAWSKPVGKVPTDAEAPPICATCSEPVERGNIRNGECNRCRMHRARYGLAFPNRHVNPADGSEITLPDAPEKSDRVGYMGGGTMGKDWANGNSAA